MNIDRARELQDARLIDESWAETVAPTLQEEFWNTEEVKLDHYADAVTQHEPSPILWLLGDLEMARELAKKAAEHRRNGQQWQAMKADEGSTTYYANAGKALERMINDYLRAQK